MNRQSGRSMIEMLGVLAIIGILSIAGIAGYTMAMHNYRANELLNTILDTSVSARGLLKGNYEEMSCETLNALGILDDPGASGSNCSAPIVGSSWNWQPYEGNVHMFTVTIEGLDTSTCSKLATTDWGTSSTFFKLTINDREFSIANGALSVSDVVSACTDDDNNTNKMVLTFK